MSDDPLALALGYLGRARLAMKQTGGGRLERAFLLEKAREMLEQARATLPDDDPSVRELLAEVEAQIANAEGDLARE